MRESMQQVFPSEMVKTAGRLECWLAKTLGVKRTIDGYTFSFWRGLYYVIGEPCTGEKGGE